MELKLLQKDVAKLCEVTEDCITNWEKNRSVPQIKYYPQIIKFLGYLPFRIDSSTLGGKLKSYRYTNGLSKKRLAEILSVDGATISCWGCVGENSPTKRMLGKIERLLKREVAI